MIFYQYLDQLPPIPDELVQNPEIKDPRLVGFHDGPYARWAAQPELLGWLHNNISEELKIAGVQIIPRNLDIHCDNRLWALNYMLETGGDHVVTGFYKAPGQPLLHPPASVRRYAGNNNLEEVFSVVFQPRRWHLINTRMLHQVHGITNGPRVAVTIGLNCENPFDVIKGYQKLSSF